MVTVTMIMMMIAVRLEVPKIRKPADQQLQIMGGAEAEGWPDSHAWRTSAFTGFKVQLQGLRLGSCIASSVRSKVESCGVATITIDISIRT